MHPKTTSERTTAVPLTILIPTDFIGAQNDLQELLWQGVF